MGILIGICIFMALIAAALAVVFFVDQAERLTSPFIDDRKRRSQPTNHPRQHSVNPLGVSAIGVGRIHDGEQL